MNAKCWATTHLYKVFEEFDVLNCILLHWFCNWSKPVQTSFGRFLLVPVRFFLELEVPSTGPVLGSSPEGSRTETGPDRKALLSAGCGLPAGLPMGISTNKITIILIDHNHQKFNEIHPIPPTLDPTHLFSTNTSNNEYLLLIPDIRNNDGYLITHEYEKRMNKISIALINVMIFHPCHFIIMHFPPQLVILVSLCQHLSMVVQPLYF